MAIDPFQKKFVINMQLRQRFSRARLFWFPKKAKGVKKSQNL